MINKKKKELLCEFVEFKCNLCKQKKELKELQIHRINRGTSGGLYNLENCRVLCKNCHKKLHQEEFSWI